MAGTDAFRADLIASSGVKVQNVIANKRSTF